MTKKTGFFISPDYPFQDKSSVYVFSNENVIGCADALCGSPGKDLSEKQVLSVCASGDHALEAYYRHADNVDTFDINSYQSCIYELKNHFLHHLRYEDFLDFFLSQKKFFDLKMLQPIEHAFSPYLIEFLRWHKREDKSKNSRMLRGYRHDTIPDVSFLKSAYDFQATADRTPKVINFAHCDIRGLTAQFQKKYDIIILSNIFDYLYPDTVSYEEKMKLFYNQILAQLAANNLKDNGTICAHYTWGENPIAWTEFAHYFQNKHITNPHHKLQIRCAMERTKNQCDLVTLLKQNKMQK